MSPLISRILLAVFMLPLAAMVYLGVFVPAESSRRWSSGSSSRFQHFVIAGIVSWAFIAIYWTLLWRQSVRLTTVRVTWGFGVGLIAAIVAVLVGSVLGSVNEGFGYFMGSAIAPMLWVVATIFVSRETPAERTERLRASGRDAVVCPTCGYNLTGLTATRCPECGSQFTLDELMAAQPGREGEELS